MGKQALPLHSSSKAWLQAGEPGARCETGRLQGGSAVPKHLRDRMHPIS